MLFYSYYFYYDFIVNEDGEMFKSISLDFGERSTDAICGNLQYLFSLLQYSERRYHLFIYFTYKDFITLLCLQIFH